VSYTIKRWTKPGQDRGYASDDTGKSWGHVDLKKGTVHLEPGAPPSVELALRAWAVERQQTATRHQASASPAKVTSPEHFDLSSNTAGQSAAAKAQAEWDAYSARRPRASKVARFLGLNTPDRSWARGAAGELEVGRRLEQLRANGWYVLHAVPIGTRGSDIDHLLIGPAGVFCINTKNHSNANVWVSEKAIMVNGQKQPYYRNSRTEGERVSRILSRATGWEVSAQPVIIVMARRYTERSRPRDVWVVGRRKTPQAFKKLPAIYSRESVETIFRVARDSATWT
jgi:hypothetical protein